MEIKGVIMDGPASCNAGSEAVGLLRSGGGGEDDAGLAPDMGWLPRTV
jgi:hypothetical protein